jgi:erythronate-4-phosphate dehydrogenase
MMRIAADENILSAREAFGQFGEVTTFAGRALRRDDLLDVDALVVRSVTRVDAALLEGTPVRFVGTATIGTDHLDLAWLRSRRITTADAAGSNSRSVAEYILACLLELHDRGVVDVRTDALGIVGMGRIGTIVSRLARSLGMTVVGYDPPRARLDQRFRSASPRELLDCRIITLHVPLTFGCLDQTWHLVDAAFLERMRSDAVLINTSRGAVAHRGDLVDALRRRVIEAAVVDVWEGEPDVPEDLVGAASLATPHIAGYSLDGKANGTLMIAEAIARHAGTPNRWSVESAAQADAGTIVVDESLSSLAAAHAAVRHVYDIRRDDAALRALLLEDPAGRRAGFDRLRRDYPVRREASCYAIADGSTEVRSLLEMLGFRLSIKPGADAGR